MNFKYLAAVCFLSTWASISFGQAGCVCPQWRWESNPTFWSYYSERQCPEGDPSTWVNLDLPVDLGEFPNQECCGGANCETINPCPTTLTEVIKNSATDKLYLLPGNYVKADQPAAPYAIKSSVATSGIQAVMDREDELALASFATLKDEHIVKVEVMKRGVRSIIHVRLFYLVVDPNGPKDPPPIHVLKGLQTTAGSERTLVPWSDVATPTSSSGAVTRFIVVKYDGRSYNVLTQNQIDGK